MSMTPEAPMMSSVPKLRRAAAIGWRLMPTRTTRSTLRARAMIKLLSVAADAAIGLFRMGDCHSASAALPCGDEGPRRKVSVRSACPLQRRSSGTPDARKRGR